MSQEESSINQTELYECTPSEIFWFSSLSLRVLYPLTRVMVVITEVLKRKRIIWVVKLYSYKTTHEFLTGTQFKTDS